MINTQDIGFCMPPSSGSGPAGVSLQDKTVTPSETQQMVSPDIGYDGLSSVTVNAVSSTYVGSGVIKKAAATYTPASTDQTIDGGQYLDGDQIIKGDANLIADNIKSGVSIFGVSGSYAGSGSTGSTSLDNIAIFIADYSAAEEVNAEKGVVDVYKRLLVS